jgi:RimJ/RimL family protein N-acetyltransferase
MPRMPDFSDLHLSTPRLRLRPPRVDDAADLFAIFGDPVVARFSANSPWPSVEFAREKIERSLPGMAAGEALRLCLVRADDGAFLGTCTLFDFDERRWRAEVGYGLAPGAWGQGYVQEAVGALLRHGFEELGLHRVEADVDPRNTASTRSLERLGFVREGLLRERWLVGDEVSDSVIYGLLQREWEAAQGVARGR